VKLPSRTRLGIALGIALLALFLGPLLALRFGQAEAAPVANKAKWTATSRVYEVASERRTILDSTIGPQNYQAPWKGVNEWTEITPGWTPAAAPWSYQSTGAEYDVKVKSSLTAGQVIEWSVNGQFVHLQPMALEWTNDNDQLQQISMPQASAPLSLLDKKATWLNAYGVGRDFSWTLRNTRLVKELTLVTANLPAPAAFIVNGGNPALQLSFVLDYSNTLTLWVNGAAWNARDKVTTASIVEFKNASGVTVYAWTTPVATDTNGDGIGLLTTLKKQGNSLYVSVQTPKAWLDSATYPVVIDPTLDLSVAAQADDDYVWRLPTTSWQKTDTTIYTGNFSASFYSMGGSMRFLGVNIPAGATVDVAYLTLIAGTTLSSATVNSDLCAENASNPSQNTSYADHIGRTRTAAVPWDSVAAWTAGTSYQSPSIVTPIQTVVTDNGGTGDALKIFWEDKDGESSVGAYRRAASWDHASYAPPAIHLEWTEGGGTPTPTPRGWNYILGVLPTRERALWSMLARQLQPSRNF